MMQKFTKEQIDQKYSSLSPESPLREALSSSENLDIISIIAEKNHLVDERTRVLTQLIALIILGLLPPEDLEEEIVHQVKIDSRIAKEISDRVMGFTEFPQYTKPEVFSPDEKKRWKVPPVLVSGDHKKIEGWRKENRK